MDSSVRLALPYVAQSDSGGDYRLAESGIAAVTALVRAATGDSQSVTEVARAGGAAPRTPGAMLRYLKAAAAGWGLTLTATRKISRAGIERDLEADRPTLLLLAYPRLPERFDPLLSGAHWILVHGMEGDDFFYHDPYYPGTLGADRRIPKEALMQAVHAQNNGGSPPGHALRPRTHRFPHQDEEVGARGLDERNVAHTPAPTGFPVSGTVTDEGGKPLANASVRLVGSRDPLGAVAGAVAAPPPGAVVWDHTLSGWGGHRWDCWNTHVKEQTGLPFKSFMEEVVTQNPVLAADSFQFHADKLYKLPRRAYVVAWSRPVTGIAGTRWNAFGAHVQEQVQGIGAQTFIDEVLRHNPQLAADARTFKAEKVYRFPENLWGGSELRWTRPLTGFKGNRNDAWHAFVKGTVEGLTDKEFFREVERWNPSLGTEDGHIFRPQKSYLLPESAPATLYYLLTWTDAEGRYRFDGVPAGLFTLEVQAATLPRHRERVTVDGPLQRPIQVRAPRPEPSDPVMPTHVGPRPGFVGVQNGQFVLNGRPFRFVGVNLRGLVHYGYPQFLQTAVAEHRTAALNEARDMGAKVVRVFLARRDVSTSDAIARLKDVLAALRERAMYAIVAFQDVHGDTGFNVDADTAFYSDDAGGKLGLNFYEAGYQNAYLRFIREVVSACKDDPQVFAWELGNEFKPLAGGQARPDIGEKFIPFAHAVSSEIAALAPSHLITTGIINSGSLALVGEQPRRLYAHPHLHFLTVHLYGGGHPDFDAHEAQQTEIQRMDGEAALARELGKPLIIEEFGWFGGERVTKTREFADRWLGGAGAAGFMQWGFMPYANMGDGDNAYGMDKGPNDPDYGALFGIFREWANRLG